jgi:hypothetical protein
LSDYRDMFIEDRIYTQRPWLVVIVAWIMVPIGFFAAYYAFWTLVQIPPRRFTISFPVVVLSGTMGALALNFAFIKALLKGRLLGWLGCVTWACLLGGLPALGLVGRVRDGLTLRTAVSLAPFQSTLILLACLLLALVCQPTIRRWIAMATRLRALTPQEFDLYLADLR